MRRLFVCDGTGRNAREHFAIENICPEKCFDDAKAASVAIERFTIAMLYGGPTSGGLYARSAGETAFRRLRRARRFKGNPM